MSKVLAAARGNSILAPLTALVSLISTIVVARGLEPNTYAEYAVLMAIVTWWLLLCELGCNVGVARYLQQAGELKGTFTLYQTLQRRRSAFVIVSTLIAGLIGPSNFHITHGNVTSWPWYVYLLLGGLTGVTLHSQLSSSVLTGLFEQKKVQVITQVFIAFRACSLVAISFFFKSPELLILALLTVAIAESATLHNKVKTLISNQNEPIPKSIANSAQVHGGVSLIDKISTALTGAPFILIIFAGIYSKNELAVFAISTDLLLKALSIVGLPIAGLVLPILNKHVADTENFKNQLDRLSGLTFTWFTICIGLVFVCLPNGLSMTLGDKYAGSAYVCSLWIIPLFFESAVRMICGNALLTVKKYYWLNAYNIISGFIILIVLLYSKQISFSSLIIELGCLRVLLALPVIYKARTLGLFSFNTLPLKLFISVALSAAIGVWLQTLLPDHMRLTSLLVGGLSFTLLMLFLIKAFPILPKSVFDTLITISGKYHQIFKRFIYSHYSH